MKQISIIKFFVISVLGLAAWFSFAAEPQQDAPETAPAEEEAAPAEEEAAPAEEEAAPAEEEPAPAEEEAAPVPAPSAKSPIAPAIESSSGISISISAGYTSEYVYRGCLLYTDDAADE